MSVEDLNKLINTSNKQTQKEKDFFGNYELLSRVVSYYVGTNMKYAGKI